MGQTAERRRLGARFVGKFHPSAHFFTAHDTKRLIFLRLRQPIRKELVYKRLAFCFYGEYLHFAETEPSCAFVCALALFIRILCRGEIMKSQDVRIYLPRRFIATVFDRMWLSS